MKALSMLAKDPKMDIFNFAENMFPPITPDTFYEGKLPALKKSNHFLTQKLKHKARFSLKKLWL